MNTQQKKEARLASVRDVAAHDWSSLGRLKVADLNDDTRAQLAELDGLKNGQQAVYDGAWLYGELTPTTQLRIDADLAIDYPELFEEAI